MRLLLAAALLAPALALMKPPTNPLLDDAKQLLGNVGKLAQKKAATAIEDLAALPEKTKKDAQSARLKRASQSRQKSPDQLSAEQVAKYEALGLTYEDGAWKRSTKRHEAYNEENDISIYARTAEPDVYDVERWQDDASSEFEDEFVVDQYMPRRKRRFVPKQSVEEEVEVSEDLTRLGFRNENGVWKRTAPRTGARTVVIEGSRGRTLEVKATTETDLHAISRLEYILTWSQLETPQNVWDASLRIARDPSFVFVWAAATARLGLLFSTQYGLDDFFSPEQLSLDASPEILAAGAVFLLATYMRKAHWSGSSGPLTVGALERSIADGWFTGFSRAPDTPQGRKENGLPYALVASFLTLAASIPRVEVLHHYVQNRLEADVASAMPLFVVEDQALCALTVTAFAIVGCGGIAGAMEYFSLNWARPPPTFSDEKNAIADALETDALSARTLEARADKCDAQRDGPAVKKCYDQAAQRALDEGEAFERVADAWLMNFHDTSTADVEVDDRARETKSYPAVAAAFVSGASAAGAYAAGGLAAPLALHAGGAVVDLLPTPADVLKPKKASFDVDAVKGPSTAP